MDASTKTQSLPVWDVFTRLFHWGLVGAIGFAWWSGEEGGNWMSWHMIAGYSVVSLVLFRLIWGFTGSPYSRFKEFLRGPGFTLSYLKQVLSGKAPTYTGHNPLGGWMVLALIVLCAVQGITGLFATDDIFTEGPLTSMVSGDTASFLTSVHKINFNVLLAAVGLHLFGVVYHQRIKREPLVQGMIHGRKPVSDVHTHPALAPFMRGAIVAAIALALFVLLYWIS